MLWTNHGTGPTYSQPGNALGGREFKVFHEIASDERAGASQAGLAVHGHGARAILADVEELLHDVITRCAAVDEEQVVVLEAGIDETFGVVDFLVETNYASDVVFSKVVDVGFGRVQRIPILDFALGVRAREGEKFLWQYPIQITVFNFLFKLTQDGFI